MAAAAEGLLSNVDLAETKDYLTSHRVHLMFEGLASELIQQRPADPAAHLIKLLQQQRVGPGARARVVVVTGIPGAGKSVVCGRLCDGKKDRVHLDYTERDVDAGTVVDAVVEAAEKQGPDGIVCLDGFPRNFAQALALQEVCPPALVVELHCSTAEAEKRLFKKGQFSEEATYTIDSIKNSLKAHAEDTQPLLKYYDAMGLVWHGFCTPSHFPPLPFLLTHVVFSG